MTHAALIYQAAGDVLLGELMTDDEVDAVLDGALPPNRAVRELFNRVAPDRFPAFLDYLHALTKASTAHAYPLRPEEIQSMSRRAAINYAVAEEWDAAHRTVDRRTGTPEG